jgi:multidrug efflux pump subunit AcrA (membrane-fusion protein)
MKERAVYRISLASVCLMAAIASGCSRGASSANSNTAAQPTVVDVTTAQAVVMQIPSYIEATGNLASDAQSDVAPAVGGKIIEVNFDIGSYVERGSVLIRLDPRDARRSLNSRKML